MYACLISKSLSCASFGSLENQDLLTDARSAACETFA
jgi:hypothetical protein